jgi:hypothetical protein
MTNVMKVQLNNGVTMPSPGFGTGAIHGWQADSDEVAEVVTEAFRVDVGLLSLARFDCTRQKRRESSEQRVKRSRNRNTPVGMRPPRRCRSALENSTGAISA